MFYRDTRKLIIDTAKLAKDAKYIFSKKEQVDWAVFIVSISIININEGFEAMLFLKIKLKH